MKTTPQEMTVTGQVTWLYHSSATFSAGILTTDEHRQLRFRGKFLVRKDEQVTLVGHMITHEIYGAQFDARTVRYTLDMAPAGLAAYLANNPAFHGIGPVKAQQIAAAFGSNFDTIMRDTPERLREVVHLSDETLTTLREEWLARSEMNALASWLSAYGLTHCQLTKIIERYGHQARTLLMADPYLLCRDVDGFGFARTDEVAQKLGTPKEHPGRLAAALRDIVVRQSEDGHCWIARDEVIRQAVKVLALDSLQAMTLVAERLDEVIDAAELVEEDDAQTTRVALPRLYLRERDLAHWLQAYGHRPCPHGPDMRQAGSLLATYTTNLTGRQRAAVKMALASQISLMVGAAGSGKSYTIAALFDIFDNLNLSVALCAPTGKAAKRLEEVAGTRAQTLHRLLGYNGREWAHTADNPLDIDVIIVDEVSMVDVDLAWHLFSAIDFTRTRLFLVGDHQQLPPVGAGNLLRDLLQNDYLPVCVLDQVIRQAGTLKENSNAILTGHLAPTAPGMSGTARPWYVIDTFKDADAVIPALLELLREKLPALGFDPVHEVQIVSPYRKGPLGTQRLNAEVQRLIQRERYGVELPPVRDGGRITFHIGDKVMQTRNNYGLDVMNGAIGVIDNITAVPRAEGTQRVLIIDFDGQQVQIPVGSDQERDLALAYVTTIHKSQGSEFPCVIVILHRQHAYMLHRNLLYTAVTRARKTAILFGDQTGMRLAVTTTTVEERRTWLSLWGTPRATSSTSPTTNEEEIPHA